MLGPDSPHLLPRLPRPVAAPTCCQATCRSVTACLLSTSLCNRAKTRTAQGDRSLGFMEKVYRKGTTSSSSVSTSSASAV